MNKYWNYKELLAIQGVILAIVIASLVIRNFSKWRLLNLIEDYSSNSNVNFSRFSNLVEKDDIDLLKNVAFDNNQKTLMHKVHSMDEEDKKFLNRLMLTPQEFKGIQNLIGEANFRGTYDNSVLDKEVVRYYEKAIELKIKVTRGSNLFKEGGIFRTCFETHTNLKKNVKILLHMPCLSSEHTKKRAKANGISPRKYIEKLFEVLKELKNHSDASSTDDKITIKFYTDHEIKWRYYIFKRKDLDKVLFINHYRSDTPGADSAILII